MPSEANRLTLEEGQIYEGPVSLSGGPGPHRRWIIVAPFGRLYGQSIDDPVELHWLPLNAVREGIDDGRLRYLGHEPEHPAVRLQRVKEMLDIRYAHVGLHGQELERMFALLESAIAAHADYAVYALGELRALLDVAFDEQEEHLIAERVDRLLPQARVLN